MEEIHFKPPYPLNIAVLFLVFNRLDTTKKVFEIIKSVKPPKIYIASDGARTDKQGEKEKVNSIRKYVLENINWPCEVNTLFREQNLGCKLAVSSAIDWFFTKEEMGIILEDDCLPSLSFFWFCEELLTKYREDERIFLISGYNKQNTWKSEHQDYFFSYIGGIWGWASWRRAWESYDPNVSDFFEFDKNKNFEKLLGKKLGNAAKRNIKNVIEKNIDTWDYQWDYARIKNSGLACVPSKNLIENIGFGKNATHTKSANIEKTKKYELRFPLKWNTFIIPDSDYDCKNIYSYSKKIKQKIADLNLIIKKLVNPIF